MSSNISRHTPARVLFIFTLLLLPAAVSAWRNATTREELEDITYPTALGDTQYFPAEEMTGAFACTVEGRPQTLTAHQPPVKLPAHKLHKVGIENEGRFYIYQQAGAPELYVRLETGSFLAASGN